MRMCRLSGLVVAGWLAVLPPATAQEPATAQDPATAPEMESADPLEPVAIAESVQLDGANGEWPERVWAVADARHVYARFELPKAVTLLRAPDPVRVHVDFDAGERAGREGHGLHADVAISLADPDARNPGRGPDLVVERFDADGRPRIVEPRDVGLLLAPTHASAAFEIRVDRPVGVDGDVRLAIEHAGADGAMRVMKIDALEAAVAAEPRGFVDGRVPEQAANTIRVMAWNVLWGGPRENPAPFARVLKAVEPQVILFQEWGRDEGMGEAEMAAWLNKHAGWAEGAWSAETGEAWGVGVASWLPIGARGPDELRTAPGGEWDFPVRLAAAAVETEYGPVVFGSVHLKCCGGLESAEDARRMAEATVINRVLSDMALDNAWGSNPAPVILGGDFNLNGTTDVLETACAALDLDGSGLEAAAAGVLGDRSAMYTFGRPQSDWPRARLDFITYPDGVATAYNAFVLDTRMLSEASLEAMGLERDDVSASDHLPVVVDVGP